MNVNLTQVFIEKVINYLLASSVGEVQRDLWNLKVSLVDNKFEIVIEFSNILYGKYKLLAFLPAFMVSFPPCLSCIYWNPSRGCWTALMNIKVKKFQPYLNGIAGLCSLFAILHRLPGTNLLARDSDELIIPKRLHSLLEISNRLKIPRTRIREEDGSYRVTLTDALESIRRDAMQDHRPIIVDEVEGFIKQVDPEYEYPDVPRVQWMALTGYPLAAQIAKDPKGIDNYIVSLCVRMTLDDVEYVFNHRTKSWQETD